MNIWEYLSENPQTANLLITISCIVLGVLFLFLLVVAFLLVKGIPIWKWYKSAKNEADFGSLSKHIQKILKKKPHPYVFASSVRDNDKGYKDVKALFDAESEILFVGEDSRGFDNKLGKYKIIVYKVLDDERGIPCPVADPLYKRIAKYCSEQHKNCILVSKAGSLLDMNEASGAFDPVYITTVNFYSKLRETLYILLFFAP